MVVLLVKQYYLLEREKLKLKKKLMPLIRKIYDTIQVKIPLKLME